MCIILYVDGVEVANVVESVHRRCFSLFDYDISRVSFSTVESSVDSLPWIKSEYDFEKILIEKDVLFQCFPCAFHGFEIHQKTKKGGYSKKVVCCFYAFTDVRSAYWSDSILLALNSFFSVPGNSERYVYVERVFNSETEIRNLGCPLINTKRFRCSHEF